MILASAGSGKTHELTNRYLRLLAGGARPERIAALTFTRKAAGEFSEAIVHRLAAAAADEAKAVRLGQEIAHTHLTGADCRRMLREVVASLHRLNLGTFDSFFGQLTRVFSLELGLGGGFEVLDPVGERRERDAVLESMFVLEEGGLSAAQHEFIEAFKLATHGREAKTVAALLRDFLQDYLQVWHDAPDLSYWGEPARIWPRGCVWLSQEISVTQAVNELEKAVASSSWDDKRREFWADVISEFRLWTPAVPLVSKCKTLFSNCRKAVRQEDGGYLITLDRKKTPISNATAEALINLQVAVIGGEFRRRLQMTRGIGQVLRRHDEVYTTTVRRAGFMTFGDIQRVLRPDSPGGASLLPHANAEEARRMMEWRLDGKIEHWLLDEFQDTSRGQWAVLRNLVDEVIQDPSGARTFFYVGDVKQAIYDWRGGDARLFGEIFAHYNQHAPDTIAEKRLDRTWRCGPEIVALVNRVLGTASAHEALWPATAQRWMASWGDHTSAHPQRAGFAQWEEAEDVEARRLALLRILRHTQALERGLSVAVLVQKNATATETAHWLRAQGIAALAESDVPVCLDNPATTALLAMLRTAAHPGDSAAWQHVQMTPLVAALAADGLTTPLGLSLHLLRSVHIHGFAETLRTWTAKLEPVLAPDDAFSRLRLRQLVEAGRSQDEAGGRDVDEFLVYAEGRTVRDTEAAGLVRVMTVHKAKGLGFDLVILPDLEGTKLASRRDGLAVQRQPNGAPDWVLSMPSEEYYEADETLARHVSAAEDDACYEALAWLYVAMTRAKYALHLITKPRKETSTALNYPALLHASLGQPCQSGDPDWASRLPPRPPPNPSVSLPLVAHNPDRSQRHVARTASSHEHNILGQALFALESGGVDFGREVHALLAEVVWLDGATGADAFAAKWAGRGEAGTAALACLRTSVFAPVWTRPDGGASEVWREQAFEIVLEEEWISGMCDRVVVTRAADGTAQRADVYDFKTDRTTDAAAALARHSTQLQLYRRVVATLTGLPITQVGTWLVLTRSGQMLEVPNPR